MGNAIHQAVLHACRNFMIPIARFLLRHGITFKEFAEVAKWAFVHVATEEYGIRGRKTNISRVAVMTGLSRKEVSGLRVMRFEDVLGSTPPSIANRVLDSWSESNDHSSSDGIMSDRELAKLVASQAGSVSPVMVKREILRLGLAYEAPGGGLKIEASARALLAESIEYAGRAIGRFTRALDRRLADGGLAHFERVLASPALPRDASQVIPRGVRYRG